MARTPCTRRSPGLDAVHPGPPAEPLGLLAAAMMVASSGATATGLVGTAGTASAGPTSAPTCGSSETTGTALSGGYHNLTVSGIACVDNGGNLNVSGNLTLAPGSCLDAFSTGVVQVGHNVTVEQGAILGLGCAPGSNGPPPLAPCYYTTTDDTVDGNITADQPLTMYLTAVTVGGNVVSNGVASPRRASASRSRTWTSGATWCCKAGRAAPEHGSGRCATTLAAT